MAKRMKRSLDAFSWHEALDRSFLAFEFFNENVAEHAAVRSNKELKREAADISKRLFRLYQELGNRTLRGPASTDGNG